MLHFALQDAHFLASTGNVALGFRGIQSFLVSNSRMLCFLKAKKRVIMISLTLLPKKKKAQLLFASDTKCIEIPNFQGFIITPA